MALTSQAELAANPSRQAAGYRPYSFSCIGDLVAHLNIIDLRNHVVQVEKTANPSKWFWGLLKVKK